jgi:hypothetical protein
MPAVPGGEHEPVNFTQSTKRPQYPLLPPQLLAAADAATNGELFWPGDRAAEAARALAGAHRLIIGGEVYARRAIGWAAYLGAWTTSAPRRDADWPAQVEHALEEALRAIARAPSAWDEPDATPEDLRFFFASVIATDTYEQP